MNANANQKPVRFAICDKCGGTVKAYWLARKDTQMLFFCNHHWNKYQPALNKQGFTGFAHTQLKNL